MESPYKPYIQVCVPVYVIYNDTKLYNDMGMTELYSNKVVYENMPYVPVIQNS